MKTVRLLIPLILLLALFSNSAYAFTGYDTLEFGGQAETTWVNSIPSYIGEHPGNNSENVNLSIAVGLTVDESNTNQTVNVTFAENTSGSFVNMQTNSSVAYNGVVNWTYTNASDYNTKYWWRVFIDDGVENETFTFHYTTEVAPGSWTNSQPNITGEQPTNQSTGVELSPAVGCTVEDGNTNHTLNVTFAIPGAWVFGDPVWQNVQTNSSVLPDGTVNYTFSSASSYSTTYYWKVWVHDGFNNITEDFEFTTKADPTPPMNNYAVLSFSGKTVVLSNAPLVTGFSPGNGTTNVPLFPQLSITVDEPQDEGVTVTWSTNATGDWSGINSTIPSGDGTYTQIATFANTSNTTYWWSVQVEDNTGHKTNKTYKFTIDYYEYGEYNDWWNFTYIPETFTYPTYFNASGNGNSAMNITWTENGNSSSTYIRYSTTTYPTTRSEGTFLTNTSNSSYNHTSLSEGTTYYYSAWSYNSTFGFSNSYTTVVNCTSPAPPSDLQATNIGMNSLTLTWTKGTGADNTIILMNETGYAQYPTDPSNGTNKYNGTNSNYEITGLTDNVTYYFTFYSWSDCGWLSDTNATISVTTASTSTSPSNLTAVTDNEDSITLTWSKGSEYTIIRRKVGSYATSVTEGTEVYNGTGITYTDEGLDCLTHYYYSAWGWNGETPSADYSYHHNITLPEPPQNLVGSISGTELTITWDKGDCASRTIIRNGTGSYPTDYNGGDGSTLVYNGTGTVDTVSGVSDIDYYTGWSWAVKDGENLYSTSVNLLWGGLEINVYKESEPNIAITDYDVFVKNKDGTESYENLSRNNPFRIDVSDVPNGDDIAIQISADGYKSRTRYMDLYENAYYTVNFYLPPDSEGSQNTGDEGDADWIPSEDDEVSYVVNVTDIDDYSTDETVVLYCNPSEIVSVELYNSSSTYWEYIAEDYYSNSGSVLTVNKSGLNVNSAQLRITYYCGYNESYAEHYIIRVLDETNSPVDDCLITIKRYINTTDSYEVVYAMYTDSNGEQSADLIPTTLYIVTLNHSSGNYVNDSYDWQPSEINYVEDAFKNFIMDSTPNIPITPATVDENTIFTVETAGNQMFINFSCSLPSVTDAHVYIYEENPSNLTTWLYADYSYTGQDSFNIQLTINTSCSYTIQLVFNHTQMPDEHWLIRFIKPFIDNKITSPAEVDKIIGDLLGTNPFMWGNFIVFLFAIAMFFYIDSKEAGKLMVLIGGLLLFLDGVVGFIDMTSGGLVLIPILMIFLGILTMWRGSNRRSR